MSPIKFLLISHGLKTASDEHTYSLPKADLYLDCRGVTDGSRVIGLVGGPTGNNLNMQKLVQELSPATITSFHRIIEDSLDKIPLRRNTKLDPYSDPYVVCFLCAHGIHRSVSSKHLIAALLKQAGYRVKVV